MRHMDTAQQSHLGTNTWWRRAKVFILVSEEVATTSDFRTIWRDRRNENIKNKSSPIFTSVMTSCDLVVLQRSVHRGHEDVHHGHEDVHQKHEDVHGHSKTHSIGHEHRREKEESEGTYKAGSSGKHSRTMQCGGTTKDIFL